MNTRLPTDAGLFSFMHERPYIDVEAELAACVRKIGGTVLVDELGPSPKFANADYLFRDGNTVAELKCMERDTRTDGHFVERVSSLHRQWVGQGLVPLPPPGQTGRATVNAADLPKQCSMQILELLRSRMQRLVKKANQQIEATKAALATDAKGLMLLANDGDRMFEMDVVLHLLDRIFKTGRYSSIDTVIYFTVNQAVTAPNVPMPAQVWTDLIIDEGGREREGVPRAVLDRIQIGWFNHLARRADDRLRSQWRGPRCRVTVPIHQTVTSASLGPFP